MPKASRSSLLNYRRALHKCSHVFTCSVCHQTFSGWNYAQHMYTDHDVVKTHTCPWYKCQIQGMTVDAHHLRSCFERFLNASIQGVYNNEDLNLPGPSTTQPKQRELNMCSCAKFDSASLSKEMFGRSRLPVTSHFYESFCEESYLTSEWFNPTIHPSNTTRNMLAIQNDQLAFSKESGLGSDAPMFIRKFIELVDTVAWFHVIVRASAFQTFYEAIQTERDHLGLLPFSCLCDGLSSSRRVDDIYIHHRHMILVSSESGAAFKRAWSLVKPIERNYKNEPCKVYKSIETAFHLVNVMRYVGNVQSNCRGTGSESSSKTSGGTHHYFINRYFHEHGDRNLCKLWPGGLQSYFQRKFGSKDIDLWCEHVTFKDGKWTVPIKVVCTNQYNCVVPYNQDFEPSNIVPLSHFDQETADGCLFLLEDQVMVLRRNSNLPQGSKWFEYQKNHGNCMNEAIQDCSYILSRNQQKCMNQAMNARKPLKKELEELKLQMESMHVKLDAQMELTEKLQLQLTLSIEQNNVQIRLLEQNHEQIRLLEQTIREKDNQILEKDRKIQELKHSILVNFREMEILRSELVQSQNKYDRLKNMYETL